MWLLKKLKPTALQKKTLVSKQNNAKRIVSLPKLPPRHRPSGIASLLPPLNANVKPKKKKPDRKQKIVSNAMRGPGKS